MCSLRSALAGPAARLLSRRVFAPCPRRHFEADRLHGRIRTDIRLCGSLRHRVMMYSDRSRGSEPHYRASSSAMRPIQWRDAASSPAEGSALPRLTYMFGVTTPCTINWSPPLRIVSSASRVSTPRNGRPVDGEGSPKPACAQRRRRHHHDRGLRPDGRRHVCTDDRPGATARSAFPMSDLRALDMVNFGAPETVPARYVAASSTGTTCR